MTITKEIALAYHKAGFHVVPVGQDKRPLCKWKQYQTAQTAEDVHRLWQSPSWGIAAITGINGLECIDVDEKYDVNGDLFLRYQRMNDKYSDGSIAFPYLTVCSTMNGGYHIFYKCDAVQGNQKLAMRPATAEEMNKHNASATKKLDNPNRLPQVLIETRGEGGYVLITPTPGYSVEYGAMRSIPEITQEQRYNLLMNARRFDEVEVPASEIDIQAKKQPVQDGKTPWDDYNEKQDIISLLESYGWSVVYEDSARVHMLRPGDSSTKTSGNYHKQHNLFRCHSTSTCLPPDKSLTASAIYTYYEHGGDFKAATKELAGQGFGEQQVSTVTVDDLLNDNTEIKQEQKKQQAEDLLAFVKSTKFDIRQPIKEEDAVLTSTIFGKQYKLAGKGMIAGVVGAQKSGKTLITSCFVASALSGKQKLTFDMDLQGKNAIYFDTEQPEFWYKKTQERIHRMAGLYDNPSNYEAYMLRRLTVKQRLDVITQMLRGRKDLSMILIDGIVDLCENFNDEGKSSETIEHLMRWSDETGALIVTVLHLTKSAGYMRGHLGTALQNKYDLGLQIENDTERGVYTIKHRDSRFAPFPGFEFLRDDRGMPVLDINDSDDDDTFTAQLTNLITKTASPDEDLPF